MGQMVREALVEIDRFALHRLARHDDVAEHRAGLAAGRQRKGREGKNIGGLVLSAPFGVDFTYLFVARKNQRDLDRHRGKWLIFLTPQILGRCLEDTPRQAFEFGFFRPSVGFDGNLYVEFRHHCYPA